MRYSIDRLEENTAVCIDDNGGTIKLTIDKLPENIGEGDIIVSTEKGYIIDHDETAERRKKMAEMQKKLFGRK